MAPTAERQVFISYSSADKLRVDGLFDRLTSAGVRCWLDTRALIPGQDWQLAIQHAIQDSTHVLVCLSTASTTRTGYVNKELSFALEQSLRRPIGSIYLIPVRLEPCVVPDGLRHLHTVD